MHVKNLYMSKNDVCQKLMHDKMFAEEKWGMHKFMHIKIYACHKIYTS